MSGFNYSRFDHIEDSDDEKETVNNNSISFPPPPPNANATNTENGELKATIASDKPPIKMTKKGKEGRLQFEHEGRVIYEWEQSLEEVNIYIPAPPGVPRSAFDIVIGHTNLKVGLKGNPPFIEETTGGPVKPDESMWTMSDGEININLQKMIKAEQWSSALVGKSGAEVDAFTQEQIKKKLLLERFQEEHPHFDFSGAEFNGSVPLAKEFMGGVRYN